jgi:hypothetical protein
MPTPILMVCGLPPGNYTLTSGCHGNSNAANFSPLVCSPNGEAGKIYKPVFSGDMRLATETFSRDLRAATKV